MRAMRFLVPTTAALALLASSACANPRAQANIGQAINDAANEISGLKNDIAMLQTQMDSLRGTVAKQDTLITRILAVNNIPR
jgi:peptidoglycan hydrolase CwlO-like protein